MKAIDLLLPEDHGHDPYNHVGRQIRRHEAWLAMQDKFRNKVFVMDSPTLDMLQLPKFQEELQREIRSKMMIPSLMGVPVIRHDAAFKINTDI